MIDGEVSAAEWRRAYENVLVEAAITSGVTFWDWRDTRWGVVLGLAFEDDDRLELYRGLPVVRGALDAVPDRLQGLIVHRGRGGGAGGLVPRHPRRAPSRTPRRCPPSSPPSPCGRPRRCPRGSGCGWPTGEKLCFASRHVADWLQDNLNPRGVGVVIEAEHLCMSLRGVRARGARTTTSALHGLLREDARSRHEFFALTGMRGRPQ